MTPPSSHPIHTVAPLIHSGLLTEQHMKYTYLRYKHHVQYTVALRHTSCPSLLQYTGI
jgi:hypothetical protein